MMAVGEGHPKKWVFCVWLFGPLAFLWIQYPNAGYEKIAMGFVLGTLAATLYLRESS